MVVLFKLKPTIIPNPLAREKASTDTIRATRARALISGLID